MKPRRTPYEIVWGILAQCRVPRRLTHIMQSCNLNTKRAKRYLDLLVWRNMLSAGGEFYMTTEHGLEYLELIERVYLALFS